MPHLFETTRIKGMELKNRLVRSATHEGMSDADGFPKKELFRLYEKLAKGGAGLIVTGYAFVTRDGNSLFQGMQGIDRDDHVPEYRKLVVHVHEHGAKIAMQIAHCGRQTTKEAAGAQPIAPSAVYDPSIFVRPREMSEGDIERVVKAFGQAARRVRESGFDAVQIHAAHGYLISQFLCPHTNRRKDRWGGSVENRMRIVIEIYRECRQQVGDDFPILIKMNGYDTMKNGLRLDSAVVMATAMSDEGFDGIEVSCGIGEDNFSMLRGDAPVEVMVDEWDIFKKKNAILRFLMRHFGRRIVNPVPFSEAYNLEAARTIKQHVKVPVLVVGGLVNPSMMEKIIADGDADYISLSRPFIAEPAFVRQIREGRREPSTCTHCNYCMAYLTSMPLRCYRGKRRLQS